MGRLLTVTLFCGLFPGLAGAQQVFETLGGRALGMGGAFVAVADDPTAVFWNPAGLASGQPSGLTIEWDRFRTGDRKSPLQAGPWQRSTKFVSLGTWPIGLSYARFDDVELVDGGAAGLLTQRLGTEHYAATILQSIVQGFVVGTTLKIVRGTVSSGAAEGTDVGQALDRGARLDGKTSTAFDVDVSVMMDAQVFRLGFTMRNLRSPTFEGLSGTSMRLDRQSRVGLAVLPVDGLTLALDLDLDTADFPSGPRRILAVGGEHQLTKRLALRGGARWNLEGIRRTVGAAGASFALKPGVWLDGHVTHGRSGGERGFGVALRAGF